MAASTDDSEDAITGINVTPLVDVILVLLIIFMVTATYIVNQSINVQLPKADTGEAGSETKNLAFVLDSGTNLFLNGDPITYEELPDRIQKARESGAPGALQALIAADQETPHGAVVRLIDTVRKNGVTDFAINVEASESN